MIIKQHNRNVEDHFVTTTLNKGRKHLEKEKKYFGATTFGFNVCFWGVSLLQSHSVYLMNFPEQFVPKILCLLTPLRLVLQPSDAIQVLLHLQG